MIQEKKGVRILAALLLASLLPAFAQCDGKKKSDDEASGKSSQIINEDNSLEKADSLIKEIDSL